MCTFQRLLRVIEQMLSHVTQADSLQLQSASTFPSVRLDISLLSSNFINSLHYAHLVFSFLIVL